MHFGVNTWTDVISERIGAKLIADNIFARERVIEYLGDIDDVLESPPAGSFAVIAPVQLPVGHGVEGGGAKYTPFDATYRVDICHRLMERDHRSARIIAGQSSSMAMIVRRTIAALQVQPLPLTELDSTGDQQSPFRQPLRLIRAVYNPRRPAAGWAYCRTEWQAFFRTDFTVTT